MNNFDYTTVPGDLLYCDRRHLDDFGVDDTKSLNYLIEKSFYKLYYTYADYENFAKDVFNTAYYICTMALADRHPHRKFGAYLSIIGTFMHQRKDEIGVVLSIVLIQIDAHKWKEIKPEMGKLALCIFNEIEKKHNDIYYSFYEQIKNNFDKRETYTIVPPDSDFNPREITIVVLRHTFRHWDWKNHFGTDMDKMLEFIFAIGKNEEEQKQIASFLQEQTHASFSNGAEHKYCFEYIERQIYLRYHAEEERAQIDAQIEEELMKDYEQQWELDYYKEEFPKLKAKCAQQQEEIEELKKKIPIISYDKENEGINILYGINNSNEGVEQKQGNQSPIDNDDNNLRQQLAEANKTIEEQAHTIKTLMAEVENLRAASAITVDMEKDFVDVNKWAKVIFFATVLNTAYQKKFTVGQQLALFISSICGGKPSTYQPLISKIASMEDNEKDNSGKSYIPQVIKAAEQIVKRLVEIPEGDSVHPTIQGYIDSICDEFSIEKPKKKYV